MSGRIPVHGRRDRRRRAGFSYVEVLVAAVVLAVSAGPLFEALDAALLHGAASSPASSRQLHLASKLEEVLARPFAELEAEAAGAGGAPTVYSDAPATPDRRVVYLLGYDGDDADADGNPLTGADADLLLVVVQREGTAETLKTLTAP